MEAALVNLGGVLLIEYLTMSFLLLRFCQMNFFVERNFSSICFSATKTFVCPAFLFEVYGSRPS